MKGLFILIAILPLWFGTPAMADSAKGLEAAQRGDYTTVFNEWLPLAEQGDAKAQNILGTSN